MLNKVRLKIIKKLIYKQKNKIKKKKDLIKQNYFFTIQN